MKFKVLLLAINVFTFIIVGCVDTKDDSEISAEDLPSLLTAADGTEINSVGDWERVRRGEILELFRDQVYGRVPDQELEIKYINSTYDNNALCGLATMKEVVMQISGSLDTINVNLLIYLPKNVKQPVPLFLGMNFYGNHTIHMDKNISLTESFVRNNDNFCITANRATHESRGVRAERWPVERILERGYGLATIYYGDIDPDFYDEFRNGIHGLIDRDINPRDSSSWGSISAWAWGLSRAMDYIETDPDIDQHRVAVMGHSRLGKTTLWAGAQDERFAMVISNNSGCGGAALSRRKSGELLSDINTAFPHWFCKRFHSYNDREEDLPVDQHMLLALIAPRPVYVASAIQDAWADPPGEYLSLYYAGDVFRLYGYETLQHAELPATNMPLRSGRTGYHVRSGAHNVMRYDWERYMDFADEESGSSLIHE